MVKPGHFVAAALAAAFAPYLSAQMPAEASSAVIHVETREVPVDVTVTGKKGASQPDLTAKDFSVWEDGKPQKINSVTSASADPETSVKHFLIYFEFTTMPLADQVASEKSAAGFVEGLASPDRYMAVVSLTNAGPRVLADFTTVAATLKSAVNAQPSSAKILDPQIDLKFADSLATACHSMAPAAGRKALLLYTGGNVAKLSAFKAPIETCNRANVAIYVIAGSASDSVMLQNRQSRQAFEQAARNTMYGNDNNRGSDAPATFAKLLADSTGGQALTFDDSLKDQLAAVAREQDNYYRVFYTPPPSKEGACHTIRVAVTERGLDTRARNEYCTEKPADLVAGKVAGQALEAQTANAPAAGALAPSMQLSWFYTGTNRASVHLSADLVPELRGQIDLVGTVLRPDGGTAARFADTRTIDPQSQQYRYQQQFTVAAGTYVFQLAIGAGANVAAKVEVPLKIEPWNSTAFGIGSIAFSTETHPIDTASASIAPILEGQGPLVANGRQFVPAATNRFQRSAPVYFYTEFYAAAMVGLKMEYCILDRKTGEVKGCSDAVSLASLVRPGNPVVPFGTQLPALAQLPAGQYRLEVRGAIPNQPMVTRAIDFELN